MATVTKLLVRMDSGAFEASYDYDDVTLRVLAIRAENKAPSRGYTIRAVTSINDRTYATTLRPSEALDQSIPQNVANRLQLSVNERGQLVGVTWSVA